MENSSGTGGQVYTLDQLGITSLGTNFTAAGITDSSGNIQVSMGSFIMQDGSIHQMGDYLFQANTELTIPDNILPVPESIQQLPYLPGSGTIYDSWQSMVRDQSGVLESLIESFATENDPTVRSNIMDQILYQWTNSENIAPNSSGSNVDARQLNVLEQFYYGQEYIGDPNQVTGPQLTALYNNIKEYL